MKDLSAWSYGKIPWILEEVLEASVVVVVVSVWQTIDTKIGLRTFLMLGIRDAPGFSSSLTLGQIRRPCLS